MFGLALEVAIGCTVNCRASAIIYRLLESMRNEKTMTVKKNVNMIHKVWDM